jgi:hypothetical protein
MKIYHLIEGDVLTEVNIADKIINDPSRIKMLSIAWKHDHSLPLNLISKLGPNPTDKDIVREWGEMLEKILEHTDYGDLSKDYKFADWLKKLYITGAGNWEDISGEGVDALAAWNALAIRGHLDKEYQDLNIFKTIKQLQKYVSQNNKYERQLAMIKDEAIMAQMKKDKKEIVLIDDDRFWVAIPLNFGACYTFNYTGHPSNFCTGGSQGVMWFSTYAPSSMLIMIVDKKNHNKEDGKWQLHAESSQLANSIQDHKYDKGLYFSQLFPGLMKRIISAIEAHADTIKNESKDIAPNFPGYDVANEIERIKNTFPLSFATPDKKD